MIKQNKVPFIRPQKQKQLLIKVILVRNLNQSIVQLYQILNNLLGIIFDKSICFIMLHYEILLLILKLLLKLKNT